jgi:hypothetical protein
VELYLHSPIRPPWRGAQLKEAQGQLYLNFDQNGTHRPTQRDPQVSAFHLCIPLLSKNSFVSLIYIFLLNYLLSVILVYTLTLCNPEVFTFLTSNSFVSQTTSIPFNHKLLFCPLNGIFTQHLLSKCVFTFLSRITTARQASRYLTNSTKQHCVKKIRSWTFSIPSPTHMLLLLCFPYSEHQTISLQRKTNKITFPCKNINLSLSLLVYEIM